MRKKRSVIIAIVAGILIAAGGFLMVIHNPGVAAWFISKGPLSVFAEHEWDISESPDDSVRAIMQPDHEGVIIDIDGSGRMISFDREDTRSEAWHRYINMSAGWLISISSVKVGEGVTNIGGCAFADCAHLEQVDLPSTITEIGTGAFQNCTALKTINYDGTTAQWRKVELRENWLNMADPPVISCRDGEYKE